MRKTALYLGGLFLATGAALAVSAPAQAAPDCGSYCGGKSYPSYDLYHVNNDNKAFNYQVAKGDGFNFAAQNNVVNGEGASLGTIIGW
ncbi:hypothetical protein [Actinoplanes sp. NPDC049802]|uniref:hypothetical protein n=1 Tax=Actinoplanes sp. NPDC049802 TaxID=3154742 RepID=UPI0033C0DE13